jgi:hypothetical protein
MPLRLSSDWMCVKLADRAQSTEPGKGIRFAVNGRKPVQNIFIGE